MAGGFLLRGCEVNDVLGSAADLRDYLTKQQPDDGWYKAKVPAKPARVCR